MRKRSPKFKIKRRKRIANRLLWIYSESARVQKDFLSIEAPENFSFIDNTDEILKYIIECKKLLHTEYKIQCDLSNISNLSSDAIALLAACINNESYLGPKGEIKGNAPNDTNLRKLFLESGFYNYVNASKSLKLAQRKDSNLFHCESNVNVEPFIAKKACRLSLKDSSNVDDTFSDLFEMLVEAMSNTNNHANKETSSNKIKWWLYTYNAPDGSTTYTFIDLGVGIFDSVPATNYKRLIKKFGLARINIKNDFSDSPGARYRKDGPHSGKEFLEDILRPKYFQALENHVKLIIELDGVGGIPLHLYLDHSENYHWKEELKRSLIQ